MKNLPLILLLCVSAFASAQATDSAAHYLRLGKQEMDAKRYLIASRNFEKSLTFSPENIEAIMHNGYAYLEMRKLHPAMESFKKVNSLQPSNAEAIEQLTNLYFNFRQYDKAIEMARKCRQCGNANRIIGLSQYQLENFPEAEKELKKALDANGDDAEVAYTLGRNYLDMEEYNKAIPYYEKAVLIDPTKSLWMYELGLIYYNQAQYKPAVIMFDKAAAAGYVQSNDFKENFGFAALYAGDTERGETLLLEVIRKKPGNTEILMGLAEILYQQKKFDKSLEYCQQMLEKNPNNGKALYQAGLNFQKKGEKDRGQQMCDKAIEMDPSLASLRKKKEMPF